MQGLPHHFVTQQPDCFLHVTLIGNTYVKQFTNAFVSVICVLNDRAVNRAVRNDNAFVLRCANRRVPQRNFLNHAGHVGIDIPHKVSDDKRFEKQNHHAARDIAQRILRRKADNDSDNAAGCQQGCQRV